MKKKFFLAHRLESVHDDLWKAKSVGDLYQMLRH